MRYVENFETKEVAGELRGNGAREFGASHYDQLGISWEEQGGSTLTEEPLELGVYKEGRG